jgi:hypothetical protein
VDTLGGRRSTNRARPEELTMRIVPLLLLPFLGLTLAQTASASGGIRSQPIGLVRDEQAAIPSGVGLSIDATVGFQHVSDIGVHGQDSDLLVSDADHDGRQEFVTAFAPYPGPARKFVFFEDDGTGSFAPTWTVRGPGNPIAIGDVDGDGLTDFFFVRWSSSSLDYVRWEACSPSGFPDHETWTAPKLGGVANYAGTIGDIDGDGIPELITADNGFGGGSKLLVYEAGPSDTMILRYETMLQGTLLAFAIADFDMDGHNEFAVADSLGQLSLFEGIADNTIVPTQTIATGMFDTFTLACIDAGSPDGRPMLFCPGQRDDTAFHVQVFESLANNTMTRVNQTIVPTTFGCFTAPQIAAVDLYGSATPEIVLCRTCTFTTSIYAVGPGGAMTLDDSPPYDGIRMNATSKTSLHSGAIALSKQTLGPVLSPTLILEKP